MNRISKFIVKRFCRRPIDINLGSAIVSFTFDDIAQSAVTLGAKFLESYKTRGTFYVSPSLLGKQGLIGKHATEGEIKSLADSGHQISLHTFSHVSVRELSIQDLAIEIEQNVEVLQAMTGLRTFRHFSFPFGEITLQAKRYLGQRFLTMRSIFTGVNSGVVDLSALRAVALYDRLFDEQCLENLIQMTLSSSGWLIFYTHDISENPSPWGVSVDVFKQVLQTVMSSGLHVLNVEQAYKAICNPN